jgi:hypothetical protein
MGLTMTRFLTTLTLLLTAPLTSEDLGPRPSPKKLLGRPSIAPDTGLDQPDLREAWDLFWFGGRLSPSYMDYKNTLAAQEMQRWGHLTVRPQAAGTSSSSIVPTAAAPTGTGGTWVNLGPTSNTTLTHPSPYDIDSGRPVAILANPVIPTTLYLATSGGGVFECTNANLSTTSDWTWTPITDGLPSSGSSGNISLGAMAMDPINTQVLYIGLGDAFDSEGRGCFKSTDGGTTWTAATGLGNATISYDILPLTSTLVFWGTNDGLKVSSNGGASFATVSSGPVSGLAWTVKTLNASDLVCSAETIESGPGSIYYSHDSGTTWQGATLPSTGFPIGRITLATSPADASTVWGICENITNGSTGATTVGPGFLKSTTKGATWTWVTPSPAPFTSYVGGGSSDTGDGGQGFYNQLLTVAPGNVNELFLAANLAAWRSLDGGGTCAQLSHWYGYGHAYSHADFHAATWSGDGATLYVANDGGLSIFRDPFRPTIPSTSGPVTTDITFIDNHRNKGLTSHLVYNVGSTAATAPADSKWRISLGTQDDGTRIRQPNTPGGSLTGSEGAFDDRIGGDGFATLIHPADGTQMLGSIYYTDIYKSTDGGQSFTESITGITEANSSTKAPFQPRLAQGDGAHPNTVYTATNGTVYLSTNFGSSWTALPTTNLPPGGTNATSDPPTALYIRNFGAAPNDPNALGIAANQGRVYLSYNGGSSWTQAGPLPNNGTYTSSICFDQTNSQVVYVSSVAPVATNNHLWKSTNGGSSWTAIDGSATSSNGMPFGIPIHVVRPDPATPSKVYVGTDFGVYYSTNGGTSWNRFGSNLPMVAVRDLYLAPDGSLIRAATFGRGIWELQSSSANPAVSLAPTSAVMVNSGTQAFTPTETSGTANTVTWSAITGTIGAGPTASGTPQTYTAPGSGTSDTLTVVTVDTPQAQTSAAITLVAPSSVTVSVSPAAVDLLTGTGTQSFTASVSPLTNTAVLWSGTGVNASGLFGATGLAANTYSVTATSQAAPSRSSTASVNLIAPSSITVSVSPASTALGIGATQTFTATVTGPTQTANRAVTWSTSGGGTITTNGVLTATAPGSFTVTATNAFSGVTGTATVAINAAKPLDLNHDGVVDLRDLLFFAKYYGTANTDSDLNGDGIVDDQDLALLIAGL